jgi:hypothetical protein
VSGTPTVQFFKDKAKVGAKVGAMVGVKQKRQCRAAIAGHLLVPSAG